ncbi:cupin domain-containing protein [Kocuria sabuli]|uniref:cupin domain-containing protein n=1 Tax=Kocuria sabuli TaxID=3071448 RepID=UPI0034D609D4
MPEVTSAVFHADSEATPAEPFEVGTVRWLRKPGQGGREALSAGIWEVAPAQAPEAFDLPIHQDESIYIVSGHLRIDVQGGDTLELTAGSMASFTEGAMTRWQVLEPTVEFLVYS